VRIPLYGLLPSPNGEGPGVRKEEGTGGEEKREEARRGEETGGEGDEEQGDEASFRKFY
jgi:hypothetical protein